MQYMDIIYTATISVLIVAMLAALVRTFIGPTRADRIVGVNLIGTLSTMILAILSVSLKQSWLLDVCLVYCLMSLIAVVILSKLQIAEKLKRTSDAHDKEENLYE